MIISKSKLRTPNNQKASGKKGCALSAKKARIVLKGYPINPHSMTNEEIDNYFSHEKIECLICGKQYKQLHNLHLRIHSITQDEYREMYDLPFSKALMCPDLINKKRENVLKMMDEGILDIKSFQKMGASTLRSSNRVSIYKKRKSAERGAKNIEENRKRRKVTKEVYEYIMSSKESLKELVKKLGIHKSTISAYRNNRKKVFEGV